MAPRTLSILSGLCVCLAAASAAAIDFVPFETGPVRPLALSADGSALYALNAPDGRLEIFDIAPAGLLHAGSVRVGLEPCALAVAPDGRVWVVNHLSDSVSIVDVAATPPRVDQTLLVGDEPRDVVFAGTVATRAFVTTAHRGQHRTHASIAAVPGAGDPQLSTEGIPRADVWVFDASSPGTAVGGNPVEILSFFADTPRALAASPDGSKVYVAAFLSGNQTTSVPRSKVCSGFDPFTPCVDSISGLPLPGGAEGPPDNAFGVFAPATGIILKLDPGAKWRSSAGVDWTSVVNLNLPDHDVFAVDADTLAVGSADVFDHVGTVLFNMAVNPTSGTVYVSNVESPNHVRFEGPGVHGGSTVQGHLSEARISILSGASSVSVRHLNKHLDYAWLHTANDPPTDALLQAAKPHSLATPLDMVVSSDGATLYVAAFGSARVGVYDVAALEADSFDPTTASASHLATGGGPAGLALDEARDRLYVLTRFDNAVSAIDLASGSTFQSVPLHNPEPAAVVEGRPFLYDAAATSGNGEASCSSCHVFGDLDGLAWNLGDPDAPIFTNTQPAIGTPPATLHSMKGPMTTQTLRGLATHGAMHWRGDRVDGFFGLDPCTEPSGAPCDEDLSFRNFIVAFEGLVGRDGPIAVGDMQKFSDFALSLVPPPNPVRALDNSLDASQSAGRTVYFGPVSDAFGNCNLCHELDPAQGFFGANGLLTGSGENVKTPHLRNAYAKIGMFGPASPAGPHLGDQVRGFGFVHDGSTPSLADFIAAAFFPLSAQQRLDVEQFVLAFDTDLAPVVGQQVTLTASNSAVANPRIDLLLARAATPFDSLALGGTVTECDVIVKGEVGGAARGWVYAPGVPEFQDDVGGAIGDVALRALAATEGPLTYTCVPPGSGTRAGINRDRDALLDGLDNCPDAPNDLQTDTDGDLRGDACDQDDDGDTLLDVYETDTGSFVSGTDTGSDPLLADSDGDGFDDGVEVAGDSDPNDPQSVPVQVPIGLWPLLALALLLPASARLPRSRPLHQR